MSKNTQALVKDLKAQIENLNRLYEISTALNANLDFDAITDIAISLTDYLGASSGQIHLIADTGEIYFKSSYPEQNELDDIKRKDLVRRTLSEGFGGWVLKTGQSVLVLDTQTDSRWLAIEHHDQTVAVRSVICSPIVVGPNRLRGILSYVHPDPNYFDEQDLGLLDTVGSHVAVALENTAQLIDIQSSLQETHLMLDLSRQFAGAQNFKDVYAAFVRGMMVAGTERCVLYMSDEFDTNGIPRFCQAVFVDDLDPNFKEKNPNDRLILTRYPILLEVALSQEILVIGDTETDERLTAEEQALFQQFGTRSLTINPLVAAGQVISLVSIEYRTPHNFNERELALYRALCNQATLAIENARQGELTQTALAETQSLYRAGRVLAGAADLQEILQEALIEFLYSLGVEQGGIILLSHDKQYAQLMAYVEKGMLQNVEELTIPIKDDTSYQQTLLAGQPFVSPAVPNDPRLKNFHNFNTKEAIKSLLQAPMIYQGETIGWIEADTTTHHREFSQREIDLARAMADQIAITIQNRRLLEQTQRRAEQLRAMATVGEQVSRLIDVNEILNNTVNLIRDRFGFYHVSIFLVDEQRKWAVVRASTGEVGKIMVETPHRLAVGGQSIVGYATSTAKSRIALDVGKDAVHFKNKLLPDTRSEMALPLIARGNLIGALDVQSVQANAFSDEDVGTLQIMADQLAAAIENARLFEETQRRLMEQAALYNIGAKLGSTLDLQEATDNLVTETTDALGVVKCDLTLIEEDGQGYIISEYAKENNTFRNDQGERYNLNISTIARKILKTKQEFIFHMEDNSQDVSRVELDYFKSNNFVTVATVPVLLRNKIIALLAVFDSNPNRRFTQQDIVLLDAIALQAANAIENARLYQNANESQTFLKSIIDHIPDPIVIKDRNHRWMVVNRALAEDLIGLPEDQILGKTDYDYSPKEEADWFWAQDNQVFETGQIQEFEEPYTDPNGRKRILYTRKAPLSLTGNDQNPEYLITIINDITERKQRELERERLIKEAEHRLNLLQTAAEVSKVGSVILNVDQLIETSVNLIRNQFDFYYVGLFLLDEARKYAVLRAGTGEAGRQQLEVNHKLEIGGESMIGWCVQQRQARIALDVGQDRVRFQNPYLPDTRSEMALPLISRDEVIGALTVQSVEPNAFSDEDIVVLQTMADQLANAIANANLFAQTEAALTETETLYQVTQELLSTDDEETVYKVAMEAIVQTGVDSCAIYTYIGDKDADQMVEQKAVWTWTGAPAFPNGTRFKVADMVIEQLVPRHDPLLIENVETDQRLTDQARQVFLTIGIHCLLALPLSTFQTRLGFLLIAYKTPDHNFSKQQMRFCSTISQQMVAALSNLRLLDASQRRARREEIIREITGKISSSVNVEDVMKTTVAELSKVLGASQGGITLNVGHQPAQVQFQAPNGESSKDKE